MRTFLRFFFSPSAPEAADLPAVFFAALVASGLGAFEATVDAGALLAVDAGYIHKKLTRPNALSLDPSLKTAAENSLWGPSLDCTIRVKNKTKLYMSSQYGLYVS